MPALDRPLRHLGFLTLGFFDPADPLRGHEETLDLISLGEELGFDSVWLRQRHLETAISAPLSVIAAATQRTSRIALGTAVIPLGGENPFRLAEELNTVDLLSRGRLNPGFSVGTPQNWQFYKEAAYPETWETEDLTHGRAQRLIDLLRDPVVWQGELDGVDELSVRSVQPQSPGLLSRTWHGSGSRESARWGAEAGLNLLTSNVNRSIDGSLDFAHSQAEVIREFFEHSADPETARVSQGLVVIPTDSASPAQIEKYREYKAERDLRVGNTNGLKGNLFAEDLLGTSAEIADRLRNDEAYRLVDEVAFALPFTFTFDDHAQILHDIVDHLAPELGWTTPAAARTLAAV